MQCIDNTGLISYVANIATTYTFMTQQTTQGAAKPPFLYLSSGALRIALVLGVMTPWTLLTVAQGGGGEVSISAFMSCLAEPSAQESKKQCTAPKLREILRRDDVLQYSMTKPPT